MKLWEDPRVARGMRAQLALRRQRLDGGDQALGWKVGFAAPAMLKLLDISGPLVGFLTENARVPSGGSVSFAGWTKPVAEPEIAVHIGRDVAAGADRAAAAPRSPASRPRSRSSTSTLRPRTPNESSAATSISATWCSRRGSGPARAAPGRDGLTCRIIRRGIEIARTSDPQANTGEWIDIVRHVADVLAAFGEKLRAGEIIITGSVVPPLTIEPGEDRIAFEVDPIGRVSVNLK